MCSAITLQEDCFDVEMSVKENSRFVTEMVRFEAEFCFRNCQKLNFH